MRGSVLLVFLLLAGMSDRLPAQPKEYELPPPDVESDGRPYLGVVIDQLSPSQPGVLVASVARGGPADQAGVTAGDRILAIDGQPVASLDDVAQILADKKPGQTVTLLVERGRKSQQISVTLGAQPASPGSPNATEPPESPAGQAMLGIYVESPRGSLWPFGQPAVAGVRVVSVVVGSPADRAGLSPGDVIVSLDGQPVTRPSDVVQIVRSKRPGDAIQIVLYSGGQLRQTMATLSAAAASPPAIAPWQPQPGDQLLRRFFAPPPALSPILPPDPQRQEIERLRREVEALQAKVRELESKLRESGSSPEDKK